MTLKKAMASGRHWYNYPAIMYVAWWWWIVHPRRSMYVVRLVRVWKQWQITGDEIIVIRGE
jgi:hypothetical protein